MRRIPMEAKKHIIWRYFTKGMDYSCGNCFIIKARYFLQIQFYGGVENVYKENKPIYFEVELIFPFGWKAYCVFGFP